MTSPQGHTSTSFQCDINWRQTPVGNTVTAWNSIFLGRERCSWLFWNVSKWRVNYRKKEHSAFTTYRIQSLWRNNVGSVQTHQSLLSLKTFVWLSKVSQFLRNAAICLLSFYNICFVTCVGTFNIFLFYLLFPLCLCKAQILLITVTFGFCNFFIFSLSVHGAYILVFVSVSVC